jgi:hypothetical protein
MVLDLDNLKGVNMSFDKALYPTPLAEDYEENNDVEIEISDGFVEEEEEDEEFGENIAEYISESELASIAGDLIQDYEDDVSSRKDWMQTYVDGLELLGMRIEERSEPWEGACGVYHPLLAEALVKFQSETIMETFPAAGPVKTRIIGKETPAIKDAAERVKEDMNYQLTEVMVEFRPEHERMLWGLGLAGNAFKKVYFDPALDRQVSLFVPAEDVVVPYGSSNLETSERVTHVMRKTKNDLKKLIAAGFYRDIELSDPVNTMDEIEKKIAEKMGFRANTDDRYKLLEMQVNLDLPGYEDKDEDGEETGIALPYIITIDKNTQDVLAIRRNWRQSDDIKQKRSHFVHYGYIPGFGFYCFGLIHLIGAFAKSGTSIIRQLVDAGTLSNLPGGLKTKGMRVKGDDTPISPGEFRDVDVASGTIRDNILPLPYKEPSQVLFQLMNQIIEDGRRFASAADLNVSDMSANAPVGTTLAILERTLKVMSAVQARIYYSMKQEFKLLKMIIRDCTPEEYSYQPIEGSRKAKQADYDLCDVIPVSDPNASTMSQKVVQYQAVMQMAGANPQIYDQVELNRQMLEVLGIKNIGKLIPNSEDQKPKDPVSENMAILNGKPVKAFIYQDHEAHIQVHMSLSQDPKVAKLLGQDPQAQVKAAAGMAHINEHIAFQYRKEIEEQLGVPLPDLDKELSADMEIEVSRMMAAAAQKLLKKDQAEVAQQQAQQAQQDPIVQMQQQELQLRAKEVEIKGKEVELKEKKIMIDAAAQADKLELDKAKVESEQQLAGLQIGAKVANQKEIQENQKAALEAKMQLEGTKLGVKISEGVSQIINSKENKPKDNK